MRAHYGFKNYFGLRNDRGSINLEALLSRRTRLPESCWTTQRPKIELGSFIVIVDRAFKTMLDGATTEDWLHSG